jgi:hypothetical protein
MHDGGQRVFHPLINGEVEHCCMVG